LSAARVSSPVTSSTSIDAAGCLSSIGTANVTPRMTMPWNSAARNSVVVIRSLTGAAPSRVSSGRGAVSGAAAFMIPF
jgi:hypothetical protein